MPIVKLFKRRTRRRRRTWLKNVGYLNNFCNFRLFSFCLNVSTSVNMEKADSTHQHEGGCAPDPHVFKANGGTGGSPASPTLRFLFFPFFLLLLLFFFRLWWWGVGGLLPGHINPFPHQPNPHHLFPAPPSPQGEYACAERVGGWGAGVFNNAAFKCCSYFKMRLPVYFIAISDNSSWNTNSRNAGLFSC